MAKGNKSGASAAVQLAAFVPGAAAGIALAAYLVGRGLLPLDGLFSGYVQVLDAGGGQVSFRALLWDSFRWPLLAWVLGFTALGRWLVPLLFSLRGFFLAFCVAGLTGALGGRGMVLAALVFGLGGLVTLPILFILGARSWEGAGRLRGRLLHRPGEKGLQPPGAWRVPLVCFAVLGLLTVLEYRFFPPMLRILLPMAEG